MKVGKKFLTYFDTIEYHAIGRAISIAILASTSLEEFGYAKIEKIEISNTNPAGPQEEGRDIVKPKIVVKMKKTDKFNKLLEISTQISKENTLIFDSL